MISLRYIYVKIIPFPRHECVTFVGHCVVTPFMTKNKKNEHIKSHIKGSGHYWYLVKLIISIKPQLVTSNGERLIVRNGSL